MPTGFDRSGNYHQGDIAIDVPITPLSSFNDQPSEPEDPATATPQPVVSGDYEPVIASNFAGATYETTLLYEAKRDAFTDNVRTDVTMFGGNRDLVIDAVCFDDRRRCAWVPAVVDVGSSDTAEGTELSVLWRLNDEEPETHTLQVELLGDAAHGVLSGSVWLSGWLAEHLWGRKTSRSHEHRGVQEEVFDLDAFADTPVHLNLVNCGSY